MQTDGKSPCFQEGSFENHATTRGPHRTLYVFEGQGLQIDGHQVEPYHGVELAADKDIVISNGKAESRMLLLQSKPIEEPVVQSGPFVMNTQDEIRQAYADYRKTQFGGWPWNTPDPTHPREKGRFASHSDGTEEVKS